MPKSEAFLSDNIEFLKSFKDKSISLGVIDPPYGIGQDGSTNHTRGKKAKSLDYKGYDGNDQEPPPPEYFEQLFRVTKNQIIWGANHFIDRIPYASPCWLIWDKVNGKTDFADCELAWTSFKTAARIFHFRWQGMLQGNMKDKEKRIHPNQKPLPLYQWIYRNYAKPGFSIIDTHMGSQNSRIAAYKEGLDYYGCEHDPHYFKEGNLYFKSKTEIKPTPLFL